MSEIPPTSDDDPLASSKAVPGLAPPEPRGREVLTVVVGAERVRVRKREREPDGRRHTYDYDWLTGPNVGYGFTSSGPFALSDEEHAAAVRDFLAQIDPRTGFLGGD